MASSKTLIEVPSSLRTYVFLEKDPKDGPPLCRGESPTGLCQRIKLTLVRRHYQPETGKLFLNAYQVSIPEIPNCRSCQFCPPLQPRTATPWEISNKTYPTPEFGHILATRYPHLDCGGAYLAYLTCNAPNPPSSRTNSCQATIDFETQMLSKVNDGIMHIQNLRNLAFPSCQDCLNHHHSS